jgi:hypothetical protein
LGALMGSMSRTLPADLWSIIGDGTWAHSWF